MTDRPPLNIRSESVGKAAVLAPEGEIGYPEAAAFRVAIRQALDPTPERLVIDLALVEYMNTPGVATLVEALQICKRTNVRLVLCGLNDRVRAIFEIARLQAVFDIRPALADALAT